MGGFHLFDRSDSKDISDDYGNVSREEGTEGNNNNHTLSPHEEYSSLHPLSYEDLIGTQRDLVRRRVTTHIKPVDIDFDSFTVPTEGEIKDKGKSDALVKFVALIHTAWFVLQCIARGAQHLQVTHLEIVTLAYAAMNVAIYITWWDKPQSVSRPVRVLTKSNAHDPESRKSTWQKIRKWRTRVVGKELYDWMYNVGDFIAGDQDRKVDLREEENVPVFWSGAGGLTDFVLADCITLGMGLIFGSIHCIAWIFSFPTHMELLLWRISSVAIAAIPIYIPILIFIRLVLDEWSQTFSEFVMYAFLLPSGLLYIVARLATLVLAFMSLRDLSPGAYSTVNWTTYLPHVA